MMDFIEWMKSTGLSAKSATSYKGAITGRLTKWAQTHGLTTTTIADIPALPEFILLSKQLRKTPEFLERNRTGNGMYAAALSNYQRYLEATHSLDEETRTEYGPHHRQVATLEAVFDEPFVPQNRADARERVLREIVRRRGQQKFRKKLISAYRGRCAITQCPVTPLLEAAHITPYLGPETNAVSNGLLLRADLHTLWDLGLIAVDPHTWAVWVSSTVLDPTYQALTGKPLTQPDEVAQRPALAAIEQQWCLAHEKLNRRVSTG